MKIKLLFSVLALLSLFQSNAMGAAIYTYTGTTIDQASPPHVSQLGNNMSVVLTFADLLPGNSTNLAICPNGCTETVLDFVAIGGGPIVSSSTNGGQMLANGVVSTDASGNIVSWSMTFIVNSFAIVTSSTGNTFTDLPVPVIDAGEFSNTHWGASAAGSWATQHDGVVSSPNAAWLLAFGLPFIFLRQSARNPRRD